MGAFFGFSSDTSSTKPPNPNPYIFNVRKMEECGDYLLVLVNYPDCTTFGGDKLMILDMSREELEHRTKLDPHFFHDGYVVARFPPTEQGWDWAKQITQETGESK